MTAAFDLLDAQVQAFGRPVRCAGGVAGEDLGAPRGEGAAQGADLFDLVLGAAGDDLVEEHGGGVGIAGEVDVAHRLFGQPRPEDLVVGVTHAQAEQHPVMAPLVESFVAGEKQLADAVERVVLAASMVQRLVLDTSSHLVEAAVGDAHDVERIGDPGHMREVGVESSPVGLGQIGGHHIDARQPGLGLSGEPFPQVIGAVASTMSITIRASRSTNPVAYSVA